MKEGKLASRVGPMPGENEPLHAYVTGPTRDIISKACEKVGHTLKKSFLFSFNFQIKEIIAQATCGGPQQNDLRALQLRELAMMKGTLRPEDLLRFEFFIFLSASLKRISNDDGSIFFFEEWRFDRKSRFPYRRKSYVVCIVVI